MLGHELELSEIEDYSSWYLTDDADALGYDKHNYDKCNLIRLYSRSRSKH